MKRFLGHVICLVVFASILGACMEKFLEFLPFFAMGVVITLPFYGCIAMKTEKIRYMGKFLSAVFEFVKRIHFFSKRSAFYMISLGLAVLMNWEGFVHCIGQTVACSLMCFGGTVLFWEVFRFIFRTCFAFEIPKCIDCVKNVFQSNQVQQV